MNASTLESTLTDIIARLRQGRFQNEQAVSQGIVLPILRELGWDIFDTTLVWPEYQTGEGRADFALCHPPSKPAEFIEVKPPGKAEDGVRQALEYAFHTGVPFIVLTDGRTWSFYLPAEQGSYEAESARRHDDVFGANRRYCWKRHQHLVELGFAYERVVSGEALDTARKSRVRRDAAVLCGKYRSRNRRSQARAAIPEAWRRENKLEKLPSICALH